MVLVLLFTSRLSLQNGTPATPTLPSNVHSAKNRPPCNSRTRHICTLISLGVFMLAWQAFSLFYVVGYAKIYPTQLFFALHKHRPENLRKYGDTRILLLSVPGSTRQNNGKGGKSGKAQHTPARPHIPGRRGCLVLTPET